MCSPEMARQATLSVIVALSCFCFPITNSANDLSIGFLAQAVPLRPEAPTEEKHIVKGVELYKAGNSIEAEKEFRRAIQINPASAEAYNNLGLALLEMGQVKESVHAFEDALRLRPEFLEARSNIG